MSAVWGSKFRPIFSLNLLFRLLMPETSAASNSTSLRFLRSAVLAARLLSSFASRLAPSLSAEALREVFADNAEMLDLVTDDIVPW